MKTIKELNDPKYSDEFGYKQALKDVIKLIKDDKWLLKHDKERLIKEIEG